MTEQLNGAVVTLRPFGLSDVESLASLLNDPLVTRHQLTPPPRSRDGLAEWTRLMQHRRAERTAFTFAVSIRGTTALVGIGQLFRRVKHAETEWGWLVTPGLWGTGLFFDLCAVLRRFAREELGATELIARASTSNSRAISALRKLGAEFVDSAGAVTVWRTRMVTEGPTAALVERALGGRRDQAQPLVRDFARTMSRPPALASSKPYL